ncbi:MAG: DUF4349 domain-containing protein [Pseudomonadota bacterium]
MMMLTKRMLMVTAMFTLLTGGALLPCTVHAVEQASSINSSLTVQVADRDKTAAALIARAEALGGYFSSFSKDAVTLKVPVDTSRELINFVKTDWKPVQQSYRAEDLSAPLGQIRARLKAKLELYTSLEKMLATADAANIIEVETAATKLIQEIEGLKGRMRALQHRLDFSTVTVSFSLLQRERPLNDGNSPFVWLNDLGLENLLREFEQ